MMLISSVLTIQITISIFVDLLLIVELMLWFKASACVFGLRAGFPCFKCEYDQYFLGY